MILAVLTSDLIASFVRGPTHCLTSYCMSRVTCTGIPLSDDTYSSDISDHIKRAIRTVFSQEIVADDLSSL